MGKDKGQKKKKKKKKKKERKVNREEKKYRRSADFSPAYLEMAALMAVHRPLTNPSM